MSFHGSQPWRTPAMRRAQFPFPKRSRVKKMREEETKVLRLKIFRRISFLRFLLNKMRPRHQKKQAYRRTGLKATGGGEYTADGRWRCCAGICVTHWKQDACPHCWGASFFAAR